MIADREKLLAEFEQCLTDMMDGHPALDAALRHPTHGSIKVLRDYVSLGLRHFCHMAYLCCPTEEIADQLFFDASEWAYAEFLVDKSDETVLFNEVTIREREK